MRCVLKYNSFSVNYAQMAGTEKNYKEHSGVSRGAALKRAHGSNDIAVFVASRRVEDNRRASFFFSFFTGFISDASNVEQRAHRAGISLRATETSSGSLHPLSSTLVSGAAIPRGRPTMCPVFIVWLCVSRNHK